MPQHLGCFHVYPSNRWNMSVETSRNNHAAVLTYASAEPFLLCSNRISPTFPPTARARITDDSSEQVAEMRGHR